MSRSRIIAKPSDEPVCLQVLDAAVAVIGGEPRSGQREMVSAIDEVLRGGGHLLVQAGTGTGKSLGYLAPALAWAQETGERVLVATATLALQTQLATKDIPVALDAAERITGIRQNAVVVKGRSNYACLLKIRQGTVSDTEQGALLSVAELASAARSVSAHSARPVKSARPVNSARITRAAAAKAETLLGTEVLMLREWAEEQAEVGGLGDRDDAPSHSPRAWAQVSVAARECVGAAKCPFGAECFVEYTRARARQADIVVTNHTLLAIDAIQGTKTLPECGAIVIDEAHDLADRVTGAASAELSPQQLERAVRQVVSLTTDNELADELADVVALFGRALDLAPVKRVDGGAFTLVESLSLVAAVFKRAESAVQPNRGGGEDDEELLTRSVATAACGDIWQVAERMAELRDGDVVWVSERPVFGRQLVVAPLDVAQVMQEKVFADTVSVLTSATLKVGGGFESLARQLGFSAATTEAAAVADDTPTGHVFGAATAGDALNWRGLDVGSPFDYPQQGICYFGKHLEPPNRDGIAADALAEIAELLRAVGGRTLGLFASLRNAETAADYCRNNLPDLTVLCQGEAQLAELTRRFIAEPQTSLFGTLSLWQGVDVPGATCSLVIIDKIPFPRPDDPLFQARQRSVSEAGGNGFMQVAATHAGLLLAQGAGRLIRRPTDRGVVAILDPRIVTARYGSFLRASLPPFWMTTDLSDALEALRRLSDVA
ncbi:MAG: ATP-dependent DNA helicase [Propionibacteriaceae bacterium]|jgi:ATP-dependent DNA helicase DinG|nr:ATP-dependent DNA helicase [Propionibacteriaceae bacterium]